MKALNRFSRQRRIQAVVLLLIFGVGYGVGKLSDPERSALQLARDEEYRNRVLQWMEENDRQWKKSDDSMAKAKKELEQIQREGSCKNAVPREEIDRLSIEMRNLEEKADRAQRECRKKSPASDPPGTEAPKPDDIET